MNLVRLTFSYQLVQTADTLSLTVSEEVANMWHKNTGGYESICRELLRGNLAMDSIITNIRLSEVPSGT